MILGIIIFFLFLAAGFGFLDVFGGPVVTAQSEFGYGSKTQEARYLLGNILFGSFLFSFLRIYLFNFVFVMCAFLLEGKCTQRCRGGQKMVPAPLNWRLRQLIAASVGTWR